MGWANGEVERSLKSLVLLHAFPLDHRMWDGVADEIAKSGWQVFTPDFRGFGGATDWSDEQPPSLRVLSEDVLSLMNQFGIETFVIGGCSLGGYVAMDLLRIAPERIAGAIFMDTKASADSIEQKENRLRVAKQVEDATTTEAFWRAMLPNVLGAFTTINSPEIVQYTKALMSQSRVNGVANLQRAMSEREDSHKVIENFKGPILSLRGTEDTVATEVDHANLMKVAQDGFHVNIENCGHLPPIEKPDETAKAVIDFLNQLARPTC